MAELTKNDFSIVDVYDESYDESYDDEILEESEREYNEQSDESDESDEKENPVKKQDSIYMLVFKKYLEKECERNEFFKAKYKEELIECCYKWVKDNVKKLAVDNVAMIQSGTVFKMAVDYFNDEIYEKEQKAKAEKEQKEKERQAKEEEKRKAELEKKAKEDEWKALRQKIMERPRDVSDKEREKFEQEKYKHLEQQNLFDF